MSHSVFLNWPTTREKNESMRLFLILAAIAAAIAFASLATMTVFADEPDAPTFTNGADGTPPRAADGVSGSPRGGNGDHGTAQLTPQTGTISEVGTYVFSCGRGGNGADAGDALPNSGAAGGDGGDGKNGAVITISVTVQGCTVTATGPNGGNGGDGGDGAVHAGKGGKGGKKGTKGSVAINGASGITVTSTAINGTDGQPGTKGKDAQ